MNKTLRIVVMALLLITASFLTGITGTLSAVKSSGAALATSATSNPVKITKQPVSVCVKNGATVTVQFTATGEGLTYKWYFKEKGATAFAHTETFKSNSYIVEMNAARNGRQIYCVVTDKYGNSAKTNTVTISMPVCITKQPVSVTAKSGNTATVSFTAAGEGLTYKWYFKDKGASAFALTETFKSNTYTVEMNAVRNGRQIYCVVTDKYGNTAKTNTVTLHMGTPLAITRQPVSVAKPNGSTAIVNFSVQGDGLTYKWYFKNKGTSQFLLTETFKGNTYTTTMNAERNGRQIYCVVTDKHGNSVKTNTITLSIPVSITKQPTSVCAKNGAGATVGFTASGDGLTYKWYFKEKGASAFALTETFKSNSYSVTMNAARNGRQIYCVVTDRYGSSVKTNTVTLSMAVRITQQPVSVSAKSGATATVRFAAAGDGLTYKWYFKNKGTSQFLLTETFKGNTYTAQMNAERNGRQVYCVVTDKYGNSVKTNTVTLSIPVSITKQPTSVCAKNGMDATVRFTAEGHGLTYKWYFKNKGTSQFLLTETFKDNTYMAAMNAERDGRQVYCVVTDQFGNSVKTDTATLYMGTPLTITRRPTPVTVPNAGAVTISFAAQGEGLTYQWYFKNKGDSQFLLTETFTGNTYTTTMNAERNGRQVYCVVTDKFGLQKTTDTVSMNMGLSPTITLQPQSVTVSEGQTALAQVGAVGENISYEWYYKNKGASSFTPTDAFKNNTYSVEMTDARDGRQIYCVITDQYGAQAQSDTVTLSMKPVYQITVDAGFGEPSVIGVKKDGKYTLPTPTRAGYSFQGWKTIAGVDFPSKGTTFKNVSVKAVWELVGTDTLQKLIACTNGGASEILITSNIVIDRPLYISHDVTIYADGDYTLKRSPNYGGDLFVVGQDKNGVTAVLHHRKAVLTIGGGKGTLTVDGNRNNMKVAVVGSAIFSADSATVNIHDGVIIRNNIKTDNNRILGYSNIASEDTLRRSGGAAILNHSGTVNMYGGIIENNLVATEHTTVKDDDGNDVLKEYGGCGGAVYNYGNFNMYGGTIRNSEALRGGAIYNGYMAHLYAGTIENNKAHTYGGALSTSSSMYANTFIGDEKVGEAVLIKGNHSIRAGGALYSNTTGPIIIYGNTVLENNSTDSSGGAIYTAGSLTVRNTTFRGNNAEYSGGAVYHHNSKTDFERRLAEFTNCVFEENTSGLGGALIFSRTTPSEADTVGTYGTVTDCRFVKNHAVKTSVNPGNGGAIYITQKSDVTIRGCEFTENSAVRAAGAVSVHSKANLNLSDSTFTGNSAVDGGALYLSSNTVSKLSSLTFTENKAVAAENGSGGKGGAIHANTGSFTVEKLTLLRNTAAQHGGAVYLCGNTLTLDKNSRLEGNSAGDHGGAVYLTYVTETDGTKNGAKLVANNTVFQANSAKSGGAISIRTNCSATLNNASLIKNTASHNGEEGFGGGAVYAGFGTLTLNNVTATENTSAGIAGVVDAVGAEVTVSSGRYENNSAPSGGAFQLQSNSTGTFKGATFIGNASTATESDGKVGGGAVNVAGSTLTLTDIRFDGNTTGYYGAAVLARKATVNITGGSVNNSNGVTGAAVYLRENTTATMKNVSVTNNTAASNGVLYINSGTLEMTNVTATDNKAASGGVLYTSGASTKVTLTDSTWKNNTANAGGAIYLTNAAVTLNGNVFDSNSASLGGAVYNKQGNLLSQNVTFTKNSAVKTASGGGGNGGAVTLVGGSYSVSETDSFTENTAQGHAGAIYVSYATNEDNTRVPSSITVPAATFSKNSAAAGGAVSIRSGCDATFNGTTFAENTATSKESSEGGGAIYVGYGELTLNGATLDGNSSAFYGGAVSAVDATVTVQNNTVFKNNSAITGTAMQLREGGSATLTDVSLTDNVASDSGNGTVYITSTGKLDMVSVTATGNKNANGGVLYASGSAKVTIDKSTFSGNTATGNGGAIDFRGGALTVTDSDFTNNTAKNGGVIHTQKEVSFTDCTMNGNSATNDGGAIFSNTPSIKVTLTKSPLIGNTANRGGAIYLENTAAHIIDSAVEQNSSTLGGAIYNRLGDLTTSGVSFAKNTATLNTDNGNGNGGAVTLIGGRYSISETDSFTENTAQGHAGAIYVSYATNEDNTRTTSSITVPAITFSKNNAAAGGAVSIRSGCDATFNGTIFTENNASYVGEDTVGGGAVYVGFGSVTFNNVTAVGNTADGIGGAVDAFSSKVTVNGGTYKNNRASSGGAFQILGDSTAIVSGTVFTENSSTATQSDGTVGGGALNVCDGTLTLTDVEFNGNTTGYYGAAVLARKATVNITGGSVINSGGATGVAVYLRENTTATMKNVSVTNNTATANGVLYINGGTLEMTNVTATDNKASSGGVLYASGNAKVTLTDSTWSNNTAGHGGAIAISWAKLTAQNSTLTENTANLGGAIYNTMGELITENTTFTKNTAIKTASGGSGNGGAVILVGGTYTASETDSFTENTAENHAGAIYVSYEEDANGNKVGGTLTVPAITFSKNSAAAGGAISIRTNGKAEFNGTNFVGNNATTEDTYGGGAIFVGYGELTLNGATLDGNTSAFYGGAVTAHGATVTVKDNTVFKNNSAITGTAMQLRDGGSATLTDVTITDNVASDSGNGTVYITSTGTLDMVNVTATGNQNTNGGLLYASGDAKLTVDKSTFSGNTATGNGGAIDFRGAELTVTDSAFRGNTAKNGGAIYTNKVVLLSGCELKENTATGKGGAIHADTETGNVSLTNCTVSDNAANYGGAVSLESGSVSVIGGTMEKNGATLGGAVYNRLGSVTLSDTIFRQNSAAKNSNGGDGHGGAISLSGGNLSGTATFENNSAENHGGAVYVSYAKENDKSIAGTATLNGGSFTQNTAMGGGAVSIRSGCTGSFESVTFTQNSANGYADENDGDGEGGGAIYVGYGTLNLTNVTATENTTDSFGGAVDAVKSTVTVSGGSYTQNTAPAGGAFYGITDSNITITDAIVSENTSTYENTDYNNLMGGGAAAIIGGKLTVSGTTLEGNCSDYYGGTVLASGATVTLKDNTTVSDSAGSTGSALYLRDACKTTIQDSSVLNNLNAGNGVIYTNSGTLDMANVTATGNKAGYGGLLYVSGKATRVTLTDCAVNTNTAINGGAVYLQNASVSVIGGMIEKNSATLGGAIYNRFGSVTLTDAVFKENSAAKDSGGNNGNGGAISLAGSSISGTAAFENNAAENHGGAVYVSYSTEGETTYYGSADLTNGTFKNNTAFVGGAISIRSGCAATLTGTELTANSATTTTTDNFGGGAIYVGYGDLTLSGVTLDGNSSGYYGGAVTAHGADVEIKDQSVFKNNVGTTGAALYLRDGGSAKLTNVSVTNNVATKGSGVVYITGAGTLDMVNVTASGNQNNNGGVLYASGNAKVTVDKSTFSNNTAIGNGGAIDFRAAELTVTDSTFNGNTAKNGGVLYTTKVVSLSGCELKDNTATGKGGAIYATDATAKVTIKDNSCLNTNTAPVGGAIYMDLGAHVSITDSTLDGNSSTAGDGGAIHVADTTATDPQAETNLEMTGVTLQNNTSSARGGALATDGTSPKLRITATDCVFYKNTSTTSGGAVAVQCGNCNSATDPTEVPIVFTNCTFRENKSTTDGGAIDVRSGSCIKIDSITAEGNTASGNAAVVYVTSNCTRLYLTGTVTAQNNTTAKSGNFSYLYNNKYTTPPKIFTTHSSDASWYADVAGNKQNVAFDLTTLP